MMVRSVLIGRRRSRNARASSQHITLKATSQWSFRGASCRAKPANSSARSDDTDIQHSKLGNGREVRQSEDEENSAVERTQGRPGETRH